MQNGCAFHGLMFEDPIQHLKDFLWIVDSIDLNGAARNTTRLRLFCFSLRNQASIGLIICPRDPSQLGMISSLISPYIPHHGLDLWLQVQIFYDHVDYTTQMAIDYTAGGRLRKLRPEEAWKTIRDLVQYEEEGWNEPESPDYIYANLEQELESMKCRVESLMRNESCYWSMR
ncbi:hypothetical protein Tco_0445638 [Tanacetum coccineum]